MGEGIGEQKWRNWCQNEVYEETKGSNSRDKVSIPILAAYSEVLDPSITLHAYSLLMSSHVRWPAAISQNCTTGQRA